VEVRPDHEAFLHGTQCERAEDTFDSLAEISARLLPVPQDLLSPAINRRPGDIPLLLPVGPEAADLGADCQMRR
jgi:hypothetical protein